MSQRKGNDGGRGQRERHSKDGERKGKGEAEIEHQE